MDHRQAIDSLAAERYILDEMTAEEREAFEAHFFSCAECAADVRAAAMMRDGVRSGMLAAEVVPFARPKSAWYRSAMLPWAVAATLALAVGYQTVSRSNGGVPAEAVPLVPSTLRPATRGAETAVAAGPAGIITLAVDLDGRAAQQVGYELRAADGSVVSSGEAPAPAAGAPLILMIPASLVQADGHYVLVVHDSAGGDLTKEEYRFRVEAR
jgi:anti-sigma factor RsiW